MIPFRFLKYIQPTNYFRLYKYDGSSVFPDIDNISPQIENYLHKDNNYISDSARNYDLSWRAVQLGLIQSGKTYKEFDNLPLKDEYRFISKYFHQAWAIYVLLIRIICLKNPILEIQAYFASRKILRFKYFKIPLLHQEWFLFESKLFQKRPKVTVIIPTLNRYLFLKDVLKDLELQDYSNLEVIIVDQSTPFQKEFYSNFNLDIKLFHQKEKALWLARNTAIKEAKGDFLLFFDDDSRVDINWISNHIKCIDYFKADLSSGISLSKNEVEIPPHQRIFKISQQLDTGNVLVKKKVFKNIDLFDRQFEKQRMGDGEFGLRCFLNGYLNVSNPFAKRLHLKVNSGGLREMGNWDAFRPSNIFDPRPIPSVLYFYRKYFGKKASIYAIIKSVPSSVLPYRFKKKKATMIIGFIILIFVWPFLLIQVLRSWKKSSFMLRQGALIQKFQ